MGVHENRDWMRAAASVLDWWHDAGVDLLVDDRAFDWFAAPPPVSPPPTTERHGEPTRAPASLPETWEAFAAWRTGADTPDASWRGAVLAAEGDPAAPLMVLVDCPERDDTDRLMQGAAGALFDNMLAAIGLSRDAIHLAAVCWRRPTTGRLPRDTESALATLALHHVGLVRPQRLLVLGDAARRAVLPTSDGADRGRLHALNRKDGTVTSVVTSYHPRFLLDHPTAKAEAWRDLLLLTEDWPQ